MRETLLCKKLSKNKVQCQTCPHYCVIESKKCGKCGVRENKGGTLYSLVYGRAAAINIDPIEKKPFFHFLPGTETFSIGTVGCNLACENCQNWDISQWPKGKGLIKGEELTPEKIVAMAIQYRCPSISYTYNEPTVFLEYALDIMKLAKKRGLRNCWVSNGYISNEALGVVMPFLDAINIDLKSFSNNIYREKHEASLQPILDALAILKKRGVWVELTTLAIPKVIDEKTLTKIAKFIKNKLGAKTPWHILRFFPEISWKLRHLYSTPIELIERGCNIGMETGLKYVYGGNVHGFASEDTYCPNCSEKMIDRTGYYIERKDVNGKCSNCKEDLDIID